MFNISFSKRVVNPGIYALLNLTCWLIVMLGGLAYPNISHALSGEIVLISDSLNVRSDHKIPTPPDKPNVIRIVNYDTKGVILSEPVVGQGYTWYEIQWKTGVTGWSVEAIDGCKTIITIEKAKQKDELVTHLFNDEYHPSDTNHDYNDYGCSRNAINEETGKPLYTGGHAGWDVQTKDVVHNKDKNVTFYSLTAGTVIRTGSHSIDKPNPNSVIAIYDGEMDMTTLYLHAKEVFVERNQMVKVGTPLGIQGATGKNITGVHVHIEVVKGQYDRASPGTKVSDENEAPNYKHPTIDPISYLYKSITANDRSMNAIGDLPPISTGQDVLQEHLPEGAKARLGKGRISEIAYSPDGTRLAVAGGIGIWLYDAQTGQELDLFVGHTGLVESVSFSPDGRTLASGSTDETIRLWDVSSGRHLRTLTGHTDSVRSVSFAPDGQTLASGSTDATIRLWDASSGRHIRTLTGHTGSVRSVSFSPDGRTLASGSFREIRLWDVASGQHIRTLIGHTFVVTSVSFAPDGQTLASGSYDATIRLWDVSSGQHLRTLGHPGWVNSVSFSPDGNTLASGSLDTTVRLWDVASGQHIRTLGHPFGVESVSFSPDGNTLASGGWQEIRLWDVASGQRIRTLTEHTSGVYSVSFSPDGRTLASGSFREIRLWDVSSGQRIRTLGHPFWVESVSFSPDGNTLASSGNDTTVRLWDVSSGRHLRTLTEHTGSVRSVSFSPDGRTLASGSTDETVRLWEVSSGKPLRTLGHPDWVSSVSFAPDGQTLASSSWGVRLWDVSSGQHIRTLTGHTGSASSVSFSPDGQTLASDSWQEIDLWDVSSGRLLHTLTEHTGSVESVSFSPDGQTLASGSRDATVRLWDVSSGRHLRTLTGHTGSVESVSFSPDGNTLASGSWDGTVLLWELALTPVVSERIAADVNNDGVLNIVDLTLVVSNFGKTGQNAADFNGDGVVNIVDLTLVAGALGNTAGAPSMWNLDQEIAPTRDQVQQWLRQARAVNLTDATFQRGILILEQLLATLTPKATALLPNYPNPFNPETWIPYQLAEPADVKIAIYAVDGKLVRTLALGHQEVGIYQSKSHAAHWGGRNAQGEPVASGVYFYTLTAGDFTATRKLLIRK